MAEAFYTLLQATVSNDPKKDRVIIVGDFNARVGADTEQWGSVIGHFGPREQNTNGLRLLNLCTTHGLLISNTWFQHEQIHQLTWFPNGNRARPGHMYDYVIISRCLRTSLLDTRVFHGTQLDTDHELVVSTFQFKIKCKRHRNTWQPRKEATILNSIQHHSFITTVNEALAMKQDRNHEDDTVEAPWQSLKDALVETEHGLPDLPLVPVQDWVSKELTNLLRKKSEAWMCLHNAKANNPNLSKLQRQYNIMRSRTNRAAEKTRNHWWSTKVAEAEECMRVAEQNGHGGSLIRELHLLRNRVSKPGVPSLLAKNGVDRLISMSHKLDRMANTSLMCSTVKNPWTMIFCCKYPMHHHPQKQKHSLSH